jgi:alpha-beta hydrolase superfamily lysophospholipase
MVEIESVLPEELDPTFRGFLTGHSQTPLAYVRWEHPDPKGRVVLSHGYGEHAERYRHTAKWLHDLGWSISAMDHRGFGRSGGRRGDASGIRAFVEDLALFLRHERNHDRERVGAGPRIVDGIPMSPLPVCPQVLLGHSFGGLVAVLDLLWHVDTLDGLILTSPVIALRPLSLAMKGLQCFFSLMAPHKPLDLPSDKGLVCSDPLWVQRYGEDPLCHRFVSAAFAKALQQGREEILPFGQELDRPILLLEAGNDTVADPDGAEELWRAVKPGLLERHRLEGFRHEILHDLRRAEAQAILEAWLNRFLEQWRGNPKALSAMFVIETKEPQ